MALKVEGETNRRRDGPRNDLRAEEQRILIMSIRSGESVNHQDTMIDSTHLSSMGQIFCKEERRELAIGLHYRAYPS